LLETRNKPYTTTLPFIVEINLYKKKWKNRRKK
jgi:hypothetical protein